MTFTVAKAGWYDLWDVTFDSSIPFCPQIQKHYPSLQPVCAPMGGPSLRPRTGSSLCQQLPPSSLNPVHFQLSFPCRYKHCGATPRAVQRSSAIIPVFYQGQQQHPRSPGKNTSALIQWETLLPSLYTSCFEGKLSLNAFPQLYYLLSHLMFFLQYRNFPQETPLID